MRWYPELNGIEGVLRLENSMGILHDELERAIAESVKVDSIRQLFAGYGVPLSEQQLDTVIQAIDNGSDSVEIDGLTESVSICPNDIDRVLLEVEGKLDGRIDGAIKRVLEEVAPKTLKSLYAALPEQLRELRTTREADDIANLAFIGGKTNRGISDKPPAAYFPALIDKVGNAAFEAQCIPTDTALLDVDQYKEFLSARRSMIAQRLNKFLQSS